MCWLEQGFGNLCGGSSTAFKRLAESPELLRGSSSFPKFHTTCIELSERHSPLGGIILFSVQEEVAILARSGQNDTALAVRLRAIVRAAAFTLYFTVTCVSVLGCELLFSSHLCSSSV